MFTLRTPKILSQEIHEISSHSLVRGGEGSLHNVPWKPAADSHLAPALLDIDWLTSQPLLPFLAQVAPAHLLYRSIMSHGMEDSLEVIEWVRGEQLQRMLDFDIWENSFEFQAGDISADKFMSWLRVWMEIGSEFAVKRFIELEEETIVLILSKLFEIIPDGVSYVTEDMRENWWQTADKKFFLRIRSNDNEFFELLKPFVDTLYLYNARIAESVFAHAAMLVRQEALDDGLRWKASRLADQGFVSRDEALKVLSPKKFEVLKKSIQEAKELEEKRIKASFKVKEDSVSLPDKNEDIEPELFDSVVHFLSVLEPEEGVRYMQLALGNEAVKQITGSQNISPEYFYEDEDFISEIAEKIILKCKKILSRVEFSNSHNFHKKNLLIEQVFCEITNQDQDNAFYLKNRIAYIANICVAGLMKSIDNDSMGRSIAIVRGALNIGLEVCLLTPSDYGLDLGSKKCEVEKSVACIRLLGPEFIFHIGWNLLLSLQGKVAKTLCKIDADHEKFRGKFKTIRHISISDSSPLEISLIKLVENQRYADISAWLSDIETIIPVGLFLALEALLGRVPMYPEFLSKEKNTSVMKFATNFKPFESLKEVEQTQEFINNLHHNLLIG